MSFWTKIVRPIATTVVRGAAATFTGGASEIAVRAIEAQRAQQKAQAAAAAAAQAAFQPSSFITPSAVFPTQTAFTPAMARLPGGGLPRLPAPRGRGAATRSRPGVGRGDGTGLAELLGLGRNGQVRRRRRQNPMNVKALRRAIRRVKAFKKIEAQVARLLPKQRVQARQSGSPGVISMAEARRALRR